METIKVQSPYVQNDLKNDGGIHEVFLISVNPLGNNLFYLLCSDLEYGMTGMIFYKHNDEFIRLNVSDEDVALLVKDDIDDSIFDLNKLLDYKDVICISNKLSYLEVKALLNGKIAHSKLFLTFNPQTNESIVYRLSNQPMNSFNYLYFELKRCNFVRCNEGYIVNSLNRNNKINLDISDDINEIVKLPNGNTMFIKYIPGKYEFEVLSHPFMCKDVDITMMDGYNFSVYSISDDVNEDDMFCLGCNGDFIVDIDGVSYLGNDTMFDFDDKLTDGLDENELFVLREKILFILNCLDNYIRYRINNNLISKEKISHYKSIRIKLQQYCELIDKRLKNSRELIM